MDDFLYNICKRQDYAKSCDSEKIDLSCMGCSHHVERDGWAAEKKHVR